MSDLKKTQLFSGFDENEKVKHGLPSTAYTSNDFFELEARQLFAKIGHLSALRMTLPMLVM